MKDGDMVRVLSETDDQDMIGTLRGQAEMTIGSRVYVYRIVRFADGHEGAYEDRELMVVEDDQADR